MGKHRLLSGVRVRTAASRGWMTSVLRCLLALVFLASLLALQPAPVMAEGGWTAYNDCSWATGQLEANITKYTIVTGSTTGPLKDYATGADTGVQATFSRVGNPLRQTSYGANAASGTDAYDTFHDRTDMTGVLSYGTLGWYVDVTLTGLDPAKTYTFATTANRNASTYVGYVTRFVLSGVDAATNASTPGVTVVDDLTVAFDTGYNTVNGYVARWTGIQSGADGSFAVRARSHSTISAEAFAFSVFMLQEELPGPTNHAPDVPVLVQPADNATDVAVSTALQVTASDQDADPLSVAFYGRPVGAGDPFEALGAVTGVASGGDATRTWPGLLPETEYEWYTVVSDGSDETIGPTWTFTTGPTPNSAPVLDPVGDRSVIEGHALALTATAGDADVADILTFSLVGAPAGATIGAGSGVVSWTPSEAQGPGVYTTTVHVCDDGDPILCDEEEIGIAVSEENLAPVLAPIGDRSVDEMATLVLTATATDADLPANTLAFALVDAPVGASLDENTGEFSWTPTEAQGPGVYTFTVAVYDLADEQPLEDQEEIAVTVGEVNRAPVLAPIGEQLADELEELTFVATATDGDLPANALGYRLAGDVPAGATITTGGAFSWTPTESQGPEVYGFDICVSDGALDDCETIHVAVAEVNAAPALDAIGDRAVNELAALALTATATDGDAPEAMLTYSLVGAPTGASIGAESGVFSWTPSEAQGPAVFTFTVKVCDDGDPILCDSEEIHVTVAEVNAAPLLAPIGDRSVDEGQELSFSATANDDDLPANDLEFALMGEPDGANIADDGAFTWAPGEEQGPEAHTLDVCVTDGHLTDCETITVTVAEVNQAPVLTAIGNRGVDELEELSFTAQAADWDLPVNALAFDLVAAPFGASIDAGSGAFSWTPAEAQGPGVYTFSVRVCDDGAPVLCDMEEIVVSVGDVNVAPTLSTIGAQVVAEEHLLALTAESDDPDGTGTLQYSLIGDVPTGAEITADGAFSWTPTEAQGPGVYTVTVRVCDGGDPVLCDDGEVAVTVDEVNTAPDLDAIPDQSVDELVTLTFSAIAMDADEPANALTYRLEGEPEGAAIDAATGEFAWTPAEAQGPAEYTFDVCVNDGALDDCETFDVAVAEVNGAPVLATIGARVVAEQELLTFAAAAVDGDVPGSLSYTLAGDVPVGAGITPEGAFTWTPTEAQGPDTYALTVRVCDDGAPALCDEEEIAVTVDEVNVAPVMSAIGDRVVDELTALAFTVTATDVDAPANALSFGMLGAPVGAMIDAHTGAFSWTPSEEQGPGVYTFTLRAYDDGTPLLWDEEEITVTVAEVVAQPEPSADLGVTVEATPGEVVVGALLTCTVVVDNQGPDAANAITVEISLPAGGGFDGAAGEGWVCALGDGAVLCTRGVLAARGAAPELIVALMAPAEPGAALVTATVEGDVADPNPANNVSMASASVVDIGPAPTFWGYLPFLTRG